MSHRQQDLGDRVLAAVDPRRGLWPLVFSPIIAAVHFTVCYISTSIYCHRSEGVGDLALLRLLLAALTVLALAGVAFCAWAAWRRWRAAERGDAEAARAEPARADRFTVRFLGRITFYLATLSFVGILFVAAPLIFIEVCR